MTGYWYIFERSSEVYISLVLLLLCLYFSVALISCPQSVDHYNVFTHNPFATFGSLRLSPGLLLSGTTYTDSNSLKFIHAIGHT